MEHWQLAQMQSLPLEAKIIKTNQRIKEWYEHWDGNVYVSFSGGKDSTVLLDLVRRQYPSVLAVYDDTGLEYPEVRQFVQTIDNVIPIKPEMRFDQVIEKYGYPVISKEQAQYIRQYRTAKSEKTKQTRWYGNKWKRGKISERWKFLVNAPFKISEQCCDIIKKKPFKKFEKETGLHGFIGNIAAESSKRVQEYVRFGCNAFKAKRPISRPLGFWTEQDILSYIKINNLPYASIYGEIINNKDGELELTGVTRTGCMFCMFGVHMEKEPNRFQKMRITHPKKYDYCINKLGCGKVLDYIGAKY